MRSRSKESEVAVRLHLFFIIICMTLLWGSTSLAIYDGSLGADGGANPNPHNLSSASTSASGKNADTETQICIFCHTPHSARSVAPLWGRPDSSQTFSIRAGLQISNAAIVNTTLYSVTADYPNGATKVCLSCHDGVTAMGILANGDEIAMSGGNALGIDLTTSHPVSFVYNSAVQTFLGAAYKWPTSAYLSTDSGGKTWVQCTICHQPHQDTKGFGGGIYPFWRVGSGSLADYDTVCLSCHTSTPSIILPDKPHVF